MAYSGNIITPPVSIHDLQKCFGKSKTDLGTLISISDINKWAKYKPIVVPRRIDRLTNADISNAKYGLTPALNSMLYSKSDAGSTGTSIVADTDELEQVLNSNAQWTYAKPGGTLSAPFRLADFSYPADGQDRFGYYHLTPPPVANVGSQGFNLGHIKTCAENTAINTITGSSAYDWQLNDPNNSSPLYSNLAFRFGTSTQYNVNNADSHVISLQELLTMLSSEYWRLAVAVQVPIGSQLSFMRLFTSKMTFYDAQSVGDTARAQALMPSMGTNQYLCKLILDYANYLFNSATGDKLGNSRLTVTNPTFKLPAILCVVKNMDMSGESRSGSSIQYTHTVLTQASTVYSAPALISRFELVITDNVDFTDSQIRAYQLVSIGIEGTGEYVQYTDATSSRVYVNRLRLRQLQAVTADTVVYYKVVCVYVTGFDGSTPETATYTVNSSVTLTAGDTKDIAIYAAPGLNINTKQQSMSAIS